MGLTPGACSWLSSYISGRTQSTIVDGYISSSLHLPAYSVPQGSVGAPLLFLMANSDLPDIIHNHPVSYKTPTGHCAEDGDSVHFVDDGTIIYSHKDPAVLSEVLSSHYNTISSYMASNKFVINAEKTHLLVMAPRRLAARREEVTIKAGEFTIKPSESETLLGFKIHQSMSWNHHIRDADGSVLKQLVTRVNGLRKLANKADFQTKLMIANGIVMSKMSYGLAMWGNCQIYLRKALQVQQLKAARAVCGYRSYYWSTRRLLSTCGWLSVNQLHWQQVMMTTHKIMMSKRPVNIHARMVARHQHGTRAAAGVSQGFGNQLVSRSFNHSATSYNNLPARLRETSCLPSFKRELKTWVQTNIDI